MSSSNVLKEFLVKIGFKVDEQKFKNFQEAIRATSKNAAEMGKTLFAASVVGGASLTKLSQQMETLYFSAQRTGSSAKELKEFSFAATQIGVSAEAAQGAIEGLAAARRTNPGLNGLLGSMGIDPKQTDNAKTMVQLLVKLHSMPHYQGAQVAALFGIDEGTFNQLEQGLPEMQKYIALREKMFAQAGVNPDDQVASSHKFMNKLRELKAETGNLTDIIAYRFQPAGEKMLDWFQDVVTWATKADKATSGYSSTVLGLVSALAGGSIAKGGFGLLLKMLGGGGGTAAGAAGEAAAGGAAAINWGPGMAALGFGAKAAPAAAGGGSLAAIVGSLITAGLVAILIGAVAAFINPKSVEHMLGTDKLPEHITGAMVKGWATGAWNKTGITKAIQSMHEHVKASGGYLKSLALIPGPIGNLATMVAKFEGHVKGGYGVYRDIAGNLTAGFGHLVRKGEDFSHLDKAGAMALLAKDLGAAVSTVSKLVKQHLSHNQADALADFVFNLGGDKFAKSTLLKKLNSGDFAGAADQFQYWNKAMNHGHLAVNSGLAARRSAEANLFRAPDQTTTINNHADIKVEGVKDPHEAGRAAGEATNHAFTDMLRNMKGAPA